MAAEKNTASASPTKDMKDIVALCKRRGFIFAASDIYGGLNGFWDFGPLGAELKNNLRDRWWRDMVVTPPIGLMVSRLRSWALIRPSSKIPNAGRPRAMSAGLTIRWWIVRKARNATVPITCWCWFPRMAKAHGLPLIRKTDADEIAQRLKKHARGRPQSDYDHSAS